ncbi:MAG: DNA repair protein RadA [Bacteroidota bacterium]
MAKAKSVFFCKNCGAESAKWIGKCPACGEWNTYVEEVVKKEATTLHKGLSSGDKSPVAISELKSTSYNRIPTTDDELDRVLGGGIVPGSLVLIGGEPGIGKSTLLLQIALKIGLKVLYVSGEESEEQLKMRADRINVKSAETFIITETSVQNILESCKKLQPQLLIIDSVQTLTTSSVESGAGSVSQIRESTAEILKMAKESQIPTFLIGHITKDGMIAGPKVLEHMVDTVLQFEGDRNLAYRILRTSKNRFGSTSELGIYEMNASGLREVTNPSEMLTSQKDHDISGISIGVTLEGNRPLLIEIQALVTPATYGTPQRSSTGYDLKRLNMIVAVLEKRGNIKLGDKDIFLNVVGGLKIEDPALDLAVVVAIVSSLIDVPLPENICFSAEVGLGGEVRAVNRVEERIGEAAKLGYNAITISKYNKDSVKDGDLRIHRYGKVTDVFKYLFSEN